MPSINGHGSSGATERVALYLRVSSEEQRDAGTIQTQRDYLERYVAERGFEVVEVYADDGVSGTFLIRERPEGLRLLDDARRWPVPNGACLQARPPGPDTAWDTGRRR
jgi:predicted site-specific integrase-resolvase